MTRHLEIERKFLVRGNEWRGGGRRTHVWQGFLSTDPARAVRVRIEDGQGKLTVKGSMVGNERPEFECAIPIATARAILTHPDLCVGSPIEKYRHYVTMRGLDWEIDEFTGSNAGLVIAEIEYRGPRSGKTEWERRVDRDKPDWISEEVTGVSRYHNNRLAEHPFSEWSVAEQAEVGGNPSRRSAKPR